MLTIHENKLQIHVLRKYLHSPRFWNNIFLTTKTLNQFHVVRDNLHAKILEQIFF